MAIVLKRQLNEADMVDRWHIMRQQFLFIRAFCESHLVTMRRVVLVMLVTFAAGCLNLDQIAQLATTADQAKPSLAAIAADFKGSCDRQNLYIPPGSPTDTPKPCTNGDDLAKLDANLVGEQNILLDYFDTVGKLASSNTSGFTKSVGSINTSFKDAGLSTAQQAIASSAGKLASAITDMVVQRYRSKKLLEILRESDGDVTELTRGLADQVAPDPTNQHPPESSYMSLLENERSVMNSYYQIPLARDPHSLSAILVSRQYDNDLVQLEARENAARAYRQMMLSLASAHTKLTNDTKNGHFDIKQIAQDLGPDVQQIGQSVIDLRNDMR